MIRKVSAEDIAIRGNGTGLEYMCPTRHFVYIFFNPVFQVSTAKNEINLFNNHVLIVAPVTFAPAGAMTPSAEFLLFIVSSRYIITKTCLYNFDPLKPHFYIVKLRFTGVYIIFLISAQAVLTSTHNLCFEQKYEKYQSFFIWKFSAFGGETFYTFEWVCFRNIQNCSGGRT